MIPVFQPSITDEDILAVTSAVASGQISGSGGVALKLFEERFAAYVGTPHAVAVSSGSTALHLAARLAGITEGDQVLMSACTNIATANAVVALGGVVVPIDSEPDTWNLDCDLLAEAYSPAVGAIFPVHIYGHPAEMRRVMAFAGERELFVVEDAAEAHGAALWGQLVGSFGDIGCFSFYANKVITCGEGGMLTMKSDELAARARKLRDLAFGSPRFLHTELGYNYRLTNFQAALGLSQLSRIEEILAAKRSLALRYTERLGAIPGLRMPVERTGAVNVFWMFGMVVSSEFGCSRDELQAQLTRRGIETRTFFCPLNLQPFLQRPDRMRLLPCPVATELWENGLYLPSSPWLTEDQFEAVCSAIEEVAA